MTKLPDKLTVRPWPHCIGSCEWEANRIAIQYNKLPKNDPRREKLYEKWEDPDKPSLLD